MAPSTRIRLILSLVLFVFMIVSIGPLPVTSTICLYAVVFRPRWFKNLVDQVYADKSD